MRPWESLRRRPRRTGGGQARDGAIRGGNYTVTREPTATTPGAGACTLPGQPPCDALALYEGVALVAAGVLRARPWPNMLHGAPSAPNDCPGNGTISSHSPATLRIVLGRAQAVEVDFALLQIQGP